MQVAHGIMQRMRELAVQSANGTNAELDRNALNLEFSQLNTELSQISTTVKFNDMTIFNQPFNIQSGANEGDVTTFTIGDLGSIADVKIDEQGAASSAITAVGNAINTLSTTRANLGAIQNRLEFKIQNLDNSAENLQAAESRIRDADMAKMMTEFTKNSILFQASTSMLAQANAIPQSVLQLLG